MSGRRQREAGKKVQGSLPNRPPQLNWTKGKGRSEGRTNPRGQTVADSIFNSAALTTTKAEGERQVSVSALTSAVHVLMNRLLLG